MQLAILFGFLSLQSIMHVVVAVCYFTAPGQPGPPALARSTIAMAITRPFFFFFLSIALLHNGRRVLVQVTTKNILKRKKEISYYSNRSIDFWLMHFSPRDGSNQTKGKRKEKDGLCAWEFDRHKFEPPALPL
jgi:hypothetical protein